MLASTLEIAETTKMIENTFRSVNIALVNELKMFLTHINIDIHECIDLAEQNLLDLQNLYWTWV